MNGRTIGTYEDHFLIEEVAGRPCGHCGEGQLLERRALEVSAHELDLYLCNTLSDSFATFTLVIGHLLTRQCRPFVHRAVSKDQGCPFTFSFPSIEMESFNAV